MIDIIILILFFMIPVIIDIIGKKKKKAAEQNKSPESDFDDLFDFGEAETGEPQPRLQTIVETEIHHPETTLQEEQLLNTEVHAVQSTVRPKAGNRKSSAKTVTLQLVEDFDDETGNDIMDGFSLRKALVYSEILKPKFDDY